MKKQISPLTILETEINWNALLNAARAAREQAYAPYSNFRVGAAILGKSGHIYAGCNIENSSYGLTLCAERNAISQAIVQGERNIVAVTIVAGGKICPPCGMCRQTIAEFAHPDIPVLLGGRAQQITIYKLGDLLPHAFSSKIL